MTPAPPIVRLGAVDSTQSVAWALAEQGTPDRTVVVAETQRAGRGRHGRVWADEPGQSLLTSIVLRPAAQPAALPALSLLAAVAVAEALERAAGLRPRLKWPNDVLVDGRKIAGILLESRLGAAPVVVLGIGVNLGPRAIPAALRARATSVALAGGRPLDVDGALAALLQTLDAALAVWTREGFGPGRERWRTLADTLGRHVTVDGVTGLAVDVDADGALLVQTAEGVRRVVAGEIAIEVGGAARH